VTSPQGITDVGLRIEKRDCECYGWEKITIRADKSKRFKHYTKTFGIFHGMGAIMLFFLLPLGEFWFNAFEDLENQTRI
jgi:hypothetical protein